jgi:hypothetical protein
VSVELLEEAAAALGEIREEVVFLGAATLSIWITDDAAPALRPTADVDLVVGVTRLIEYNRFEARLRSAGFRDEGSVLGRFLFGPDDLQVDAIPADASILGFDNRWQRASLSVAVDRSLPSGTIIRCAPPAYLFGTKLEAFAGRGGGDYFGSPDFEDIVALVDGRPELGDEVMASDSSLRAYVGAEIHEHLQSPRGRDAVIAHLQYGRGGRARAEEIVIPRLERLATSGS